MTTTAVTIKDNGSCHCQINDTKKMAAVNVESMTAVTFEYINPQLTTVTINDNDRCLLTKHLDQIRGSMLLL